MDFSSFLTSLATSFVIFLVLMFLFAMLSRRPENHVVYYPNRILKGMDPYEGTRRTRNPFAWIREAITSTEADVIRMSGVDSAVYFVFLTTVLGIFALSAVVLLPVLIPIAVTSHGASAMQSNGSTSQGSFNDLDKLSMGHVKARSPRLWAFLGATYWVSFVTLYLLWKAYHHATFLRAEALKSPDFKGEQFAVMVRDIPAVTGAHTRKEQVDSYFRSIYGDSFYGSLVATDNKQVNKIYEELEGYRKKLALAEYLFEASKTDAKPDGTRATMRTGFLGLVGAKVDSIEYFEEKINELTQKLEAEQKVTLKEKQQPAAIIFFTDRVTAAAASQSLQYTFVDAWTVADAPEPRQIIWNNLPKKYYERELRQFLIYLVVFLTIFFYMIPIGLISALTTLNNLKAILPFLKPVLDIPAVRTVLEAYLPQLALIIFLAILPSFLLFLSRQEGIPSQCHVERAASGKYFYFVVLNVFIGVTLGSTLFSTLKTIESKPNSVVSLLARSLPGSATFFLTFVALKFFVGYGLELSRVVPLIIFNLKKKYLCKTEAEIKEAWAPADLGYATRIPTDMLVVTIVLCYSVIAPLILAFGVVYFALGWLVLRNQVLKVLVPSYESYGRMWPHMFIRVVASLILYQITMLGYLAVKEFYYTPILIPLPVLSIVFIIVCKKKFYRSFQTTAMEFARHELNEIPNMDAVFRSFIPASLRSEKTEEEEFQDALPSQIPSKAESIV